MSVCRNHNPYDRWTYDHQCPVCLSKTIDEKDATIAELNARVKELEENVRESQKQDQSTLSESNERLREHITSLNCGGRDGIDVCTEDSACFVHSALSDTPSGQRFVKREVLEGVMAVARFGSMEQSPPGFSDDQIDAAQAELDRTR